MQCVEAAYKAGARWIVLCDTNGGTLPNEVGEIVSKVSKQIPGKNLGIHAHNDTENAVANSLTAVLAGVRQVQGTINGLGERCGNANLISLIPTLPSSSTPIKSTPPLAFENATNSPASLSAFVMLILNCV